ncbi:hypothetical protein GB851_09065 [Kingella kingae]|nr:hypothetical protein GB851_09065 [Kingella kingae]
MPTPLCTQCTRRSLSPCPNLNLIHYKIAIVRRCQRSYVLLRFHFTIKSSLHTKKHFLKQKVLFCMHKRINV